MSRVVILAWSMGVLFIWLFASIITIQSEKKLAELPNSIGAVVAALCAGRAAQRFAENAALNVDNPFQKETRGNAIAPQSSKAEG